jgi:hypothetical protein
MCIAVNPTNFVSFVSECYVFWSCGLSSGIQTQVKMHIDILKFWRAHKLYRLSQTECSTEI